MCLDILNDPQVLSTCGHSICQGCCRTIRQVNGYSADYACPLCRARSNKVTPNFVAKEFCNALLMERRRKENSKPLGTFCNHIKYTPSNEFTKCQHCNLNFCDSCLITHKVYLRSKILKNSQNVCDHGISCYVYYFYFPPVR